MCGRTCLTLHPDDIQCACKYKISNQLNGGNEMAKVKDVNSPLIKVEPKEKEYSKTELSCVKKEEPDSPAEESASLLKPEWRAEFNCGRSYIPSFNIAPTDITPVLVSADHFHEAKNEDTKSDVNESQTRVIVPMMWGMIPFWHKGDYRRHGLTTNNCRLEHMLESKLYARPFRHGQRCVVLCEGFYEWQTTKTAKSSERAVHLIYMPQEEGIKIYDKKTWTPDNVNLLKMAGLFDVWTDDNGDKMYSYSVITYESTDLLSWMHHRMPAILETEQQVNDWLDFKRVTDKEALAALRPAKHLEWHQVTNIVNNSRNKSDDCNKPFAMMEAQKKLNTNTAANTGKNKTLLSWLNVRKRREESLATQSDDDEGPVQSSSFKSETVESPAKRPKYRDFKKSLVNNEKTDISGNKSEN